MIPSTSAFPPIESFFFESLRVLGLYVDSSNVDGIGDAAGVVTLGVTGGEDVKMVGLNKASMTASVSVLDGGNLRLDSEMP
jgi:hypothetical protein